MLLSNSLFSELERVGAKLVDESEASNKEQEGKDEEKIGKKSVDREHRNDEGIVPREISSVVAYSLCRDAHVSRRAASEGEGYD